MKTVSNALSVMILVVLVLTSAAAQVRETRGIIPEDYFSFEFISDPHISPDGRLVAYVVTTIDQKQNRRNSNIWIASIVGSQPPHPFTTSPQSSTSPRWSPDGSSLAFISARPIAGAQTTPAGTTPPAANATSPAVAMQGGTGGDTARPQIYLLSMNGGEATRITNLKNGVASFQWSPDGSRFVVVSRTGQSDDNPSRSDVRHYFHPSYKFNDTGWFDDKRGHIWIVDAKNGSAKQITSGDDWNDSDPEWSQDGKRIAFVSDRSGKAFDESRNTDVWVIGSYGGEISKISDHESDDESPRWSPDGKTIAYVGRVHDRDHPKIWLASSGGGTASVLAAKNLDLIPGNLTWAENGRALYFETGVKGENHIFRVEVNSKEVRQVTTGPRSATRFDINDRAGRMVYLSNDFKHLDDLYVRELSSTRESQLTHLNERLLKELELAEVERFTYKGADDWDIDGFLVKPIGWVEGKKYPLIVSVHGGPAGQYGVDWYQEFQVYAAHGWAVFFANPRGSTGYGQKFERGIENEWGGKDYVDIMNGVDAVLKRAPWIDQDRMGITGGSYGGYMTNWIVSHTNRFKAAVTLRSVVNFISDDGTRDGAYGHKDDFGGDIFEKFDLYWDRSPLKYAMNVKTPTLILHSDNDYRVPLEQGEQWFRALKHFGVTTEFVIFPRENHNLTRTGEPKHLVESMNWQLYWFDRFLENKTNAVAPDRK